MTRRLEDDGADETYVAADGRLLALPPEEIHLWLAFYDAIDDDELLAAYRALLTDDERAQEGRFHFDRDRRRYLVTRALVRTVLSRYVQVDAAAWRFAANAYGRPEIAAPESHAARLSFNLSHTHSVILLGVARDRAIGVDVENIHERTAPIEIADRFFAPDEVAALAAVSPDRQQERFFDCWTLKESYIKARGIGLSLPLNKFSMRFGDDRAVALHLDGELGDDAARWQLWQFRPAAEYLAAVCAERIAGESARLVFRRVVPLRSEEQCEVDILTPPHR